MIHTRHREDAGFGSIQSQVRTYVCTVCMHTPANVPCIVYMWYVVIHADITFWDA